MKSRMYWFSEVDHPCCINLIMTVSTNQGRRHNFQSGGGGGGGGGGGLCDNCA